MKRIILIILTSIILISNLFASGGSAYEGKRFLVGFMQNENYIQMPGLILQLFITATQNTSILIKQPGYPERAFFLDKDSVLVFYADPKLEMYQSEVPLINAIEILSDELITVTAYSSQWKTSDSYAAIPVSQWGTEYVVMSYPNDQYNPYPGLPYEDSLRLAYPRSSEFMIIANEDNTVVEFVPKAITWNLKQRNERYQAVINKNECYLVKSYPTQKGTGDLTGTIITSNKPIGVLSGHVRTAIPQFLGRDWDNKDHLVEMLQPVESWGRRFITVPMLTPSFIPHGDLIRAANYYPETTVTLITSSNQRSYFLKDPGSFINLQWFNEPAYWVSDKPIQIAQYMMHTGQSGDSYGFDPAMVIVPPIEQFVQRVLFRTPGNSPENPEQYSSHYAVIVATASALNSLVLDGELISNNTQIASQVIPNTNYHYVQIKLKLGTHEISCQKGSFSGILLGIGDADSYAHIIGSSISNPFIADSTSPYIKMNYDCGVVEGTAFEMIDGRNSGLDYAMVIKDSTFNFSWDITPITDTTTFVRIKAEVIDIRQDGMFVIDIRDKNGNGERFRYKYNKLMIETLNEFDFGSIDVRDSVCISFNIVNHGDDTILIKNTHLQSFDNRILYVLSKKLPYRLPPGDTLSGIICFEPRGDTSNADNYLIFVYDCDLFDRIPIKAFIENYELFATREDFGIVRIGDTVCSYICLINNGNAPVTVYEIEFDDSSDIFSYDTLGVFPVVVEPDDSLCIKVCFTPDSLKQYGDIVTWRNQKVSNIRSYVTGQGGRPLIKSVLVDWGNRRIGTVNDTVLIMRNDGNYNGIVKYQRTIIDDNTILKTELEAVNFLLTPGDSVSILTSFVPVQTTGARLVIDYNIDWNLHEPVVYELIGIGTQPIIETIDIDFGNVRVFSNNDTLANVVASFGNEDLVIEKGYLTAGSIEDFALDFAELNNQIIPIGDSLAININFSPDKLGYQEKVIGVIHNSKPNYGKDTSYFKIMGNAIPEDTVNYTSELNGPNEILACSNNIYSYSLTNLGNTDLSVTNIELTSTNLDANWIITPTVPFMLAVGDSNTMDIQVSNDTEGNGVIRVIATLNDSLTETTVKNVKVNQRKIEFLNLPSFVTTPGDSLHWEISGRFPVKANKPVNFEITIKLDMRDYLVTGDIHYLHLMGANLDMMIPCRITQTINEVTILPMSAIDLPEDGIQWSITVPLYVFLSEERYPVITVTASTDVCFEGAFSAVPTEIGEVCVINIRAVIANNTAYSIEIMPLPVREEMKIKIYSPQDIIGEFTIFDMTGKKYLENRKINLKKGYNSLIFEFDDLTNGAYVLNFKANAISKNIKFIINK